MSASSTAALELNFIATTPTAISSYYKLAACVVDSIDDGRAGEAAKDYGVRCANARAGEHGDRQFWNQRHVQRNAIAFLNVCVFEYVGKLADFGVQLLIRQGTCFSRFAFPDQRGLVASRRFVDDDPNSCTRY